MFDDLLTSSRGPGVIGTFLAVIVLAGFCGLGMMVLNSDPVGPTPEAQVAKLKDRIIEYNEKITDKEAELATYENFQALVPQRNIQQKQSEMREQRLSALQAKLIEEESQLEDLGNSFEEYKNDYRKNERLIARGEVIDLSEVKGTRFKNAEILSVNALGMRVGIASGPKNISYGELPESLQDRFQFNAVEAGAYQEALEKASEMQAIADAEQDKEKQKQKSARIAANRTKLIARKRREIQTKQNQRQQKIKAANAWHTKALQYEQKARIAKSQGRISADPGNAKKARGTAKRLRNSAAKTERDIKKLEAEIVDLQKKIRN